MGKRQKKKYKVKKKRLFITLLVLVLLIGGSITAYKLYIDNTIKNIKGHYNHYVITNKNTTLYNKNNNEVGSISKGFLLELTNINEITTQNKYFQIKDTDYYVYYEDITKTKEEFKKVEENDNYLIFNTNIDTKKTVDLYQDDKKVMTLKNGINSAIEYQDENYYYITYLNNLFKIKKNKKIQEVETQNTEEKEADHISVLYYEKIEDKCSNYNCTTIANLKNQVKKLKENGYYTITKEEYISYLKNYKHLKEKAIILTTTSENESLNKVKTELGISIEKIVDSDGLKFKSTNKKSTKASKLDAIDRYQIKSYTTLENIVKMAKGEEVKEQEPVVNNGGQGIAVLNYHFFYDPSKGEKCNEVICLDIAKFRQHLDYLKKNNYKVLTMKEFKQWMYGEIDLPQKSVLITIDDGAMGTGKHNGNKLIPILEEYQMHATLFLITGWWHIGNYKSPYLSVQSHTHDMHQYGSCGRGQINCATYEQAMKDLKDSIAVVGDKTSFCFPFYYYSDTSLRAVKDSGFQLAFVGGNRKATRNNNKFLIPRYPIQSDITLQQFINIVS